MSASFQDELRAETEAAVREAEAPAGGESAQGSAEQTTGENQGAPPDTEPKVESPMIPRRALEDERSKRQYERELRENLERRVLELEGQLGKNREHKAQEEEIDYDKIFEDPKAVFEAYSNKLTKRVSASDIEVSREMARAQLPDYDETIGKLANMNVPGIEEAVAKSRAPAFTAYRMVKEHEKALQEQQRGSGRVSELEAKLNEAAAEIERLRSLTGDTRPVRSFAQSRGVSSGTQAPVKTIDSVLSGAWDKPLRGR